MVPTSRKTKISVLHFKSIIDNQHNLIIRNWWGRWFFKCTYYTIQGIAGSIKLEGVYGPCK